MSRPIGLKRPWCLAKSGVDLTGDGIHSGRFDGIRFSLQPSRRFAFGLASLTYADWANSVGVGSDASRVALSPAGTYQPRTLSIMSLWFASKGLHFLGGALAPEEGIRRGCIRSPLRSCDAVKSSRWQASLAAPPFSGAPLPLLLDLLLAVRRVERTAAFANFVAVFCVVAAVGCALDLGVVTVLQTQLFVELLAMAIEPALVALILRRAVARRVGCSLCDAAFTLIVIVGLGIGRVSLASPRLSELGRSGLLSRACRPRALALAVLPANLLEVGRSERGPVLLDFLRMRRLPLAVLLTDAVSVMLSVAPIARPAPLEALVLGVVRVAAPGYVIGHPSARFDVGRVSMDPATCLIRSGRNPVQWSWSSTTTTGADE